MLRKTKTMENNESKNHREQRYEELTIEYCPFCDRTHEAQKIHERTSLEIRGDIVEYMEEGFVCSITGNEDGNSWAPGKMFDENLLRARDAYRAKHNLLT